MAYVVEVQADNLVLPDGNTYNTGDEVTLTNAQYEQIASTALGDEVTLVSQTSDDGDEVSSQSAAVAPIADPATATAADVATKVNALIAALSGAGKPLASS